MKSRRECEGLIGRILAHLDGELEPGDCEALEAHLARCRDCAACGEILKKSRSLCSGRRNLPEEVRARIAASLRRELSEDGKPR